MASPLDTPTSTSASTTHTFTVSAGNQRCLIVGIEQEGTTSGAPTVTYGGQSMTNVVDIEVNPGSTSQRVTLFYLNDAGIVAASSTTISVSNSVTGDISIHAASYQDAMQTTPSNTDTDSSTGSTPNPLAACDIVTGADDAVVVALSGMGNAGTAAWGGTLTERTDQQTASATGSLADDSVPSATTIACDCTWTSQNRAAICALELEHDAGVGITSVTPSEFDMDTASVTVAGSGFAATIGASDVYLSPNDLLSEAGEVDITTGVNTWADGSINLDLSTLSAGVLADLHTMGPGARFIIVNVGGVPGTTEYFSAVTLHRPIAFEMSLSIEFAPGSTTSRLTGLTGTFAGGRIEEALNPSATNTDVAADGNREDVWNVQATTDSREVTYVFRVLYGGEVPDTITQTPTVTISAGATLVVDSASYIWTGTAASLEYHSVIDATSGSYAWTGQTASLEYHSAVDAESGSYTWTGTAASLEYHSAIDAESGSYAWTGQTANLEYHSILDVEATSYAWTGQDATLNLGFIVSVDAASYAWTGQTATLIFDAMVSAQAGAYVWTGQDATLTHIQVNTLDAESGSYLWTGTAVTFLSDLVMEADAGSYLWTGTAATLTHTIPSAAGVDPNVGFVRDVGRLMNP